MSLALLVSPSSVAISDQVDVIALANISTCSTVDRGTSSGSLRSECSDFDSAPLWFSGPSDFTRTDVAGDVTRDAQQVTGVTLRPLDNPARSHQELGADLVVDASGRGSRTPRWLSDAGYSISTTAHI